MNQQRYGENMSQIELEKLYSKRNIKRIVKKAIKKDSNLEKWLQDSELKLRLWLETTDTYESKSKRLNTLKEQDIAELLVLIASAVLKTQQKQTLQEVVGYLEGSMPFINVWNRVKTAAELLAVCEGQIYQIEKHQTKMAEVVPLYNLREDLYEWINNTEFNLPLVEKPKKVTDNHNCGYHSIKEPLITGGWLKEHIENLDYTTINILNSVEWCLDEDLLQNAPKLPEKMVGEQKDAFLKAHEVTCKAMLKAGNKFYFAWQYDTRGRMYSHGWGVNFQSFEYLKALVNPTHKERVTK